ncbi:hypothetical protein AOLI_G00265320 [Acnodon oligacanthus]
MFTFAPLSCLFSNRSVGRGARTRLLQNPWRKQIQQILILGTEFIVAIWSAFVIACCLLMNPNVILHDPHSPSISTCCMPSV